MDDSNSSTRISIKHHLFSGFVIIGGSSSSSSSGGGDSNQQKRQRSSVPHEYGDPERASNVIIVTDNPYYKNKKPIVYDTDFQKQVKDGLLGDLTGSSIDNVLEFDALEEDHKNDEPESADSNSDICDDCYEDEDDDMNMMMT